MEFKYRALLAVAGKLSPTFYILGQPLAPPRLLRPVECSGRREQRATRILSSIFWDFPYASELGTTVSLFRFALLPDNIGNIQPSLAAYAGCFK
jgi:hypothetical protein